MPAVGENAGAHQPLLRGCSPQGKWAQKKGEMDKEPPPYLPKGGLAGWEEGKAALSFYSKSHVWVGRNGCSSLLFIRCCSVRAARAFCQEVSKAGQS